jgi:acyl-CoA reductase-like NAD-dependent aldehyde dehydrogenase
MNVSSVQHRSVRNETLAILSRLRVPESGFAREGLPAASPITGQIITHVRITRPEEAGAVIGRAAHVFTFWRRVPPPRRGEFRRRPRQAGTLVGPLIDRRAFESMQRALEEARAGAIVHVGERIAEIGGENAYYCAPISARCRSILVPC